MSDYVDKLTFIDVQSLVARANTPSPGPALAAQNALREAVAKGKSAFADQVTFEMTKGLVETSLGN